MDIHEEDKNSTTVLRPFTMELEFATDLIHSHHCQSIIALNDGSIIACMKANFFEINAIVRCDLHGIVQFVWHCQKDITDIAAVKMDGSKEVFVTFTFSEDITVYYRFQYEPRD